MTSPFLDGSKLKNELQKVNNRESVNYAMVALYLSSCVSPHIGAGEPTLAGVFFCRYGEYYLHEWLSSGKMLLIDVA